MKGKWVLPRSAVIDLIVLLLAFGGRQASASESVVELPVSFQVANTNTSGAPCPFDGAIYTVQGH
ncbi:MAG: hypothetical protein ACREQQ_06230, partial [Candidatus Binatia bacterium]